MAELKSLGNESVRQYNYRNGAGDNQFGVKLGDLRVIAKRIKANPKLALELWATGNLDAMLLATLLMKPKELTAEQLDAMVREVTTQQLADWLMSYVVKLSPHKETLRQAWMKDSNPMAARAGWSLTADKVSKEPEGLDFDALLDRLETEMATAHAMPQWTMNYCLATIGIESPKHRERARAIGEKLGVYRDYPVSKGCTSPFAPIWIDFMVARQGT